MKWEACSPSTPFPREAVPCRPSRWNVRDLQLWSLDHRNRFQLLTNCVVRSSSWMSSLVCFLGWRWQCQVYVTQLLLWLVTRGFPSPRLNCRDQGWRPIPLEKTDDKFWRHAGAVISTWRKDGDRRQPTPMMTRSTRAVNRDGRINECQNESE